MRSKNTNKCDELLLESKTYSGRRCSGFLLQLECLDDGVEGFIEQTGSFFAARCEISNIGDEVEGSSYPVNFSFPNEMLYFGTRVLRPATLM